MILFTSEKNMGLVNLSFSVGFQCHSIQTGSNVLVLSKATDKKYVYRSIVGKQQIKDHY